MKKLQRLFLIGLMLIVFIPISHTQIPNLVNYTNGENVTAIAEEGNYLWVGTQGGLVRLDKQTGDATHFNKTNSALKDNHITAIVIDNNGNKWIGTNQVGLAKFDGTQFQHYFPFGSTLPHSPINSILVHGNLLWVGVNNGGFASFDGTNWVVYNTFNNPGAPSQINSVRSMAFDQSNNLWLGGVNWIVKPDFNNWLNSQIYNSVNVPGFPTGTVMDIKVRGTNIWFAFGSDFPLDGALAKFDGNQFQFWKTADGLPNPSVRRLHFDPSGLLWIGTTGGLCTFNNINFSPLYTTANSGLPNNRITSLFIDTSNNVWVGAQWEYGGLVRFSQNSWQNFNTSSSGLPNNSVGAILTSSTGLIWVGTDFGLGRFDRVSWTNFNFGNTGHNLDYLTSLAEDANGTIWIGKQGSSGLYSFNGISSWTAYNQGTPIDGRMIYDIKIDQTGKKWIATNNGLLTLDNQGNWVVYTTADGLPHNFVWTIAHDQLGNTWVGTLDGGLAIRNNAGSWSIFNTGNGLPSNRVRSIVFHAGLTWIATDNGAVSYNGTTFTHFNTSSGLPHNNLRSIAVDAMDNIWFGTTQGGIAKYNHNNWEVTNMFNSGLPSNFVRKVVIDNSNNIWVGTSGGMSLFNQGGTGLQNLTFGQGYTWFSLNVNRSTMTPGGLFPGIYPCINDEISGETTQAAYNGSIWTGTLSTLNTVKMYKMSLCSPRQQLIQGNPAPIVPISLNHAVWNWVGFLPQQCMAVGTALSGLNPAPSINDYIVGQNSFAVFNGTQWVGPLTQLCPGEGYKIRVSQNSTLTYPAANLSNANPLPMAVVEQPLGVGIQPGRNYKHTMPLIAKLMTSQNRQLNNSNDVLYAFVGNECVGAGSMDNNLAGLVLMNIGQNNSNPRYVRFKLWSHNMQLLIPLTDSIVFEPLRLAGSLQAPTIIIVADPTSSLEIHANNVFIGNVWPNPTSGYLNLTITSQSNAVTDVQIIDYLGRILKRSTHVINEASSRITINTDDLKPGFYQVITTVNSQSRQIRKAQNVIIQ